MHMLETWLFYGTKTANSSPATWQHSKAPPAQTTHTKSDSYETPASFTHGHPGMEMLLKNPDPTLLIPNKTKSSRP